MSGGGQEDRGHRRAGALPVFGRVRTGGAETHGFVSHLFIEE